jgi:hypothetical protein
MSTMFPTTRSVSEVESEGKNLLWQFPVQKKKKKCSISGYTTRLIIIPYILGLTRCKNERKDLLKKNMSECNPWLVIEYHIYSFGN